MSQRRGVRFARLVQIAGALLWLAVIAPSAFADPARIRVEVEGEPVKVGSTIPVRLAFLDQNFRPEKNDRDRTVRLEVLSTGGKQEGRGQIAPRIVKARAGDSTLSSIRFTGEAAGTVRVRVTSDGLAPGEAVIRITSGSSLSGLLVPTLHAQERGFFELLPRNYEPIPRNGISTAQFSINVDSPANRTPITWRVQTDPAVRIRYRERESVGSAVIAVEAGLYTSEPFKILEPSRPGPVRIRAQVLPAGRVDELKVEFVAPRPVRVGFEPEFYKAKPNERILALNLHLLDKDGIPLQDLAETRHIRLRSAGSSVEFESPTVTLSAAQVTGTSNVQLPGFRFGRDLTVLAEGEGLTSGKAVVTVTATELAVILIAIVGGFFGGISRHVYVVGTPRMLPSRTKNRLDPGLVGNALLSALSGVVVLLASDVGLLHGVLGLDHDTVALAFVLAVLGGFAGVRAFEVLAGRVLDKKIAVGTSS